MLDGESNTIGSMNAQCLTDGAAAPYALWERLEERLPFLLALENLEDAADYVWRWIWAAWRRL